MKQIVTITILLSFLFLTSCSDNPTGAVSQDDPVFSVQVKNISDGFAFQQRDKTTIFDIESPLGISGAGFTLKSGKMPNQVVVQLHLKGLEEFRLISGESTVIASVPSSGGLNAQSQKKISGTSEQLMSWFDPLWLKLKIVSSSQEIPLQDGYFEIVIPKKFLQGAGKSFEMQWTDFYR